MTICRRHVEQGLTCIRRDVQDCCCAASTPSAAMTFTVQMDWLPFVFTGPAPRQQRHNSSGSLAYSMTRRRRCKERYTVRIYFTNKREAPSITTLSCHTTMCYVFQFAIKQKA